VLFLLTPQELVLEYYYLSADSYQNTQPLTSAPLAVIESRLINSTSELYCWFDFCSFLSQSYFKCIESFSEYLLLELKDTINRNKPEDQRPRACLAHIQYSDWTVRHSFGWGFYFDR